TEQVTRAVAASRIPTLVAIGHEIDTSLAELAADQRASTPSNAAELLVPDRKAVLRQFTTQRAHLNHQLSRLFSSSRQHVKTQARELLNATEHCLVAASQRLTAHSQLLEAFSPKRALQRGYALVLRQDGRMVRSGKQLQTGDELGIHLIDARLTATVKQVTIE
ncbi:MAG TPA: exodeoxyribonuclease VII large subunit, partial [Candidatus Saccharimonadales bacterium]|nr:exodeoxyribonuclease VII large subunit [Candidatus Saccharimonadales bacterium]